MIETFVFRYFIDQTLM